MYHLVRERWSQPIMFWWLSSLLNKYWNIRCFPTFNGCIITYIFLHFYCKPHQAAVLLFLCIFYLSATTFLSKYDQACLISMSEIKSYVEKQQKLNTARTQMKVAKECILAELLISVPVLTTMLVIDMDVSALIAAVSGSGRNSNLSTCD